MTDIVERLKIKRDPFEFITVEHGFRVLNKERAEAVAEIERMGDALNCLHKELAAALATYSDTPEIAGWCDTKTYEGKELRAHLEGMYSRLEFITELARYFVEGE